MRKTIFISSHILSELADLCTHVGIIERGCLRAAGTLEDIHRRCRTRAMVRLEVVDEAAKAEWLLRREPQVSNVTADDSSVRFEFAGSQQEKAELLRRLLDGGVRVLSFTEGVPNLEEAFLALTEGEVG